MSKSTGNFMTLGQCIDKFGADASRIALADAGDTLDDANFDEKVANAAIMKLFVLEGWIQANMPKEPLDFNKLVLSELTLWDKLIINELDKAAFEATNAYNGMKYRNILVIFNHLLNIKESYLIAQGGEKNPFVIARIIELILTIMNPIAPHFCQSVWEKHVLPILKQSTNAVKDYEDLLVNNGWPAAGPGSTDLSAKFKYLEAIKREIRLSFDRSMTGGKKKGKGGKNAAQAEAPAAKENCIVAVGTEYPEFQKQVLEVLEAAEWTEDNKIVGKDYIAQVRAAVTDKKKQGLAMKFAAFVIQEAAEVGKEDALL